ncbi:Malate/L-lactate dehydrogenase [Bradyrhizobium sp. cf659]|nr:Malate/L-lactate dehydrogenase [Bradyrhizobium sp. cf659]
MPRSEGHAPIAPDFATWVVAEGEVLVASRGGKKLPKGALTGTGATSGGRRFANGMLAFYVDPKVVDTSHVFDAEVSRHVDFIRATRPAAGGDQVLIPGDPERKTRAGRSQNGIPLPDDTWAAIVNTAREIGVSEISIQRAAA